MTLGWFDTSGDPGALAVVLMFSVADATTLIAKTAATPSKKGSAQTPGIEIVGTEFLSISAILLGAVFWEPMAEWMMSNSVKLEPLLLNLVGRVVMVGCQVTLFAVFYIPARLLFLVEDAGRLGTWVRFSVVLLPLAWHVLTS